MNFSVTDFSICRSVVAVSLMTKSVEVSNCHTIETTLKTHFYITCVSIYNMQEWLVHSLLFLQFYHCSDFMEGFPFLRPISGIVTLLTKKHTAAHSRHFFGQTGMYKRWLKLAPCCAAMNNRSCYCYFSSVKLNGSARCMSVLLWAVFLYLL